VNAYEDTSTFCPGNTFLCEETDTTFNKCMAAIDCKMSYEMRAEVRAALSAALSARSERNPG
jgi:hypothetical protein